MLIKCYRYFVDLCYCEYYNHSRFGRLYYKNMLLDKFQEFQAPLQDDPEGKLQG